MKYVLAILFIFLFLGCRHDMQESYTEEVQTGTVVYYGDINSDSVVAIDIEDMKLVEVIASNGVKPYEVQQGTDEFLYVINRDDFNVGVLNSDRNEIEDEIYLNFKPRSIAIKADTLLLTSVNEPSAATIELNVVSPTYGDSSYVQPSSYGGDNATGHPVWIDENYFLLLDRTENSIELYVKGYSVPISKLITSSSVHHVLIRDSYCYGIAEGKQNGVSPAIVKFSAIGGKLTLIKERLLSDFSNLPSDFNSLTWGAHHGAIHPTNKYIYLGSSEGNVFVMDMENLDLVDTFKSGKGVGHLLFYNDTLITTNHYDNFKSFYDVTNPESNVLIKDLSFSQEIYDGVTMQSHTSHIVEERLYFTYNTNVDSTLYKVNLEDLSIEGSVQMPDRYCLMGSFVETTVLIADEM